MKRLLFLAALAVSVIGCEKWTGEGSSRNGLYLEGKRIVTLRSAFNGGAMASIDGTSTRCRIYEMEYETDPRWDEVSEVVCLYGYNYRGKEYSSTAQTLQGIDIFFPEDSFGLGESLRIPMTQGEYDGRCEKVSSVNVIDYSYQSSGEVKVEIEVTLTDGRNLRVHYQGQVSRDGYV